MKTVIGWAIKGWNMLKEYGDPEALDTEVRRQLKQDLHEIGEFYNKL